MRARDLLATLLVVACGTAAPAETGTTGERTSPDGSGGASTLPVCESADYAPVDVTVFINCMPDEFDGTVVVSRLRREGDLGGIRDITFEPEEPVASHCGAESSSSVALTGNTVPELQGQSFRLRYTRVHSGALSVAAALAMYDMNGSLVLGWFHEEPALLDETPFLSELGLSITTEPYCSISPMCGAPRTHNALKIAHGSDDALLHVGDGFEFETAGQRYALGYRGGVKMEGTPTGCVDVVLSDYVSFAVVPVP